MNNTKKILELEIALIQEKINTNFWQSECFQSKLETVKSNRSIFDNEMRVKKEELSDIEEQEAETSGDTNE